ncbi:unnamed protein product [Phaeothamnion confervicola]
MSTTRWLRMLHMHGCGTRQTVAMLAFPIVVFSCPSFQDCFSLFHFVLRLPFLPALFRHRPPPSWDRNGPLQVFRDASRGGRFRPGWTPAVFAWPDFDAAAWEAAADGARQAARLETPRPIMANDWHEGALRLAYGDARAAGVGDLVTFFHDNCRDFRPPHAPGVVTTNPPWGQRLGQADESWGALSAFLSRYGAATLAARARERGAAWAGGGGVAPPRAPPARQSWNAEPADGAAAAAITTAVVADAVATALADVRSLEAAEGSDRGEGNVDWGRAGGGSSSEGAPVRRQREAEAWVLCQQAGGPPPRAPGMRAVGGLRISQGGVAVRWSRYLSEERRPPQQQQQQRPQRQRQQRRPWGT